MSEELVKLVLVGDGMVGKTSLLMAYTRSSGPAEYVPTVFDNMEAIIEVDGRPVKYSLWDTAGQEAYCRIRLLSYPRTDVFLLCFSLADRRSFLNVRHKWAAELSQHAPRVPIVLVGTKDDLRCSPEGGPGQVSAAEGAEMAREIKAAMYLECSALRRPTVKSIFDAALTHVLATRAPKTPPEAAKDKRTRPRRECALL
jgi:Ras-related C3 botulinum toxin substrate 1